MWCRSNDSTSKSFSDGNTGSVGQLASQAAQTTPEALWPRESSVSDKSKFDTFSNSLMFQRPASDEMQTMASQRIDTNRPLGITTFTVIPGNQILTPQQQYIWHVYPLSGTGLSWTSASSNSQDEETISPSYRIPAVMALPVTSNGSRNFRLHNIQHRNSYQRRRSWQGSLSRTPLRSQASYARQLCESSGLRWNPQSHLASSIGSAQRRYYRRYLIE